MPCDYSKYPANWKTEIRPAVLARAKDCCESCGLPNGQTVHSFKENGKTVWRYLATPNEWHEKGSPKAVIVVLTIAHLDHDEENHDVKLDRLMAMCQLCHLRYDRDEKKRRRRERKNIVVVKKDPYDNESFTHRTAKNFLAEQLRDIEKVDRYCSLNGIEWQRNYGVFTELKFHETDEPYYFETSPGLKEYDGEDENGIDKRGKDCLEWFDHQIDRGRILFVPDIVIFHKGTPTIFIEVVYTNPVKPHKIKAIDRFFEGYLIQVYEVSAVDIINNMKDISKIKFNKIFTN